MTAQRISIFTIDFPDPRFIDYDNNQFQSLNDSLGFRYNINNNIQTLSTKGIDADQDPFGILYVPDVHTSACKDEQAQYVPANVTRQANLPHDKNYALIAVAPWYSAQCTIEYFTDARKYATKAFITYLPGNSNSQPPVLNDAAWNLEDGGSWQSLNSFPTYAVSSITGTNIMNQLNMYSGNMSTVPNGDRLSQIYADTDYVRLWGNIGTSSSNQLPSLWVFLVIVLAILLLAVSFTSVVMHIIQRRRRNDLRQRVLDGQVDLEALGVKRLNVSQQILNQMPIRTFHGSSSSESEKAVENPFEEPNDGPSTSTTANAETGRTMPPLTRHSSAPEIPKPDTSSAWSQPTCPICMDDFEPNKSQVRELPCHHVFHPECIDPFLLGHSSLCPMCKRSVLPTGVCPVKITNVMVRRERHINRVRARSARAASIQPASAPSTATGPSAPPARPPVALGSLGNRIGGAIAGRRIFSAPHRTQSRPSDIEMAMASPPGTSSQHMPANVQPPQQPLDCDPAQSRREWARQRALAMLGPRHAPAHDEDEDENVPRWRRIFRKVFPI